ncbi:translation initiation factor IF-2-like [Antechinus flavipes]|uniref:translation initiation factor IF-2-like n=1 Tax=Antechinus flavipes TaxID=38775 RepID=UPI002235BA41|nr:translation initiation factor IF-2-like [Antechinus flavipes]
MASEFARYPLGSSPCNASAGQAGRRWPLAPACPPRPCLPSRFPEHPPTCPPAPAPLPACPAQLGRPERPRAGEVSSRYLQMPGASRRAPGGRRGREVGQQGAPSSRQEAPPRPGHIPIANRSRGYLRGSGPSPRALRPRSAGPTGPSRGAPPPPCTKPGRGSGRRKGEMKENFELQLFYFIRPPRSGEVPSGDLDCGLQS